MMIVLNMIFGDDDAAGGGWVMVMTIMSERSLYSIDICTHVCTIYHRSVFKKNRTTYSSY